jgi:hypothetical protein
VPSAEEIKALLRMRLANYLKSTKAVADLAQEASGLSHAEIARAVGDAIKEAVKSLLQQRQAVRRRTPGGKE